MTVDPPTDNGEQTPHCQIWRRLMSRDLHARGISTWSINLDKVIWLRLRPEVRATGWSWLKALIMRSEPHQRLPRFSTHFSSRSIAVGQSTHFSQTCVRKRQDMPVLDPLTGRV